jgi:heme-degrading monooxygenase HmoA
MLQICLVSTNRRFHTFLRGVHEVAEEQNSEHVISLFRFRMRDLTPAQRQEYSSTGERLLTLASAMPGFISFRHYTSDNDEMLAVVEFASAEALAAWRDHPEHRKAQQRGRNDFYAEYEIINCAVLHRYGYKP